MSRRRRTSPSNNKNTPIQLICNSLLLLLLLSMGFVTIVLNLVFIKFHHSKRAKKLTMNTRGTQETKFDRQGNVLHRAIHKVTLEDLVKLEDDALPPLELNMTREQASKGKEPLLDLLEQAGVTDVDIGVIQRLPLWSTIQDLYGPGPVLFGEESCAAFQSSVPRNIASLGVAGMFNTGTNLMASYLGENCKLPENQNRDKGIKWQVPWGKHMLASFQWINTAGHESKTDKSSVLPVVLVRDPYSWMKSMCRNHYGARWHYTNDHCPNLVPNHEDYKLFPFIGNNIPVRLDYGGDGSVNITSYDSLAHLWSEWNEQYYTFGDSRIMVRYEDILFYPRELTMRICACAGGIPVHPDSFTYFIDSAKWGPGHGKEEQRTSLIPAMIKYGNVHKRIRGYTREDLQFAHTALSEELMRTFQYNRPLENDLTHSIQRN